MTIIIKIFTLIAVTNKNYRYVCVSSQPFFLSQNKLPRPTSIMLTLPLYKYKDNKLVCTRMWCFFFFCRLIVLEQEHIQKTPRRKITIPAAALLMTKLQQVLKYMWITNFTTVQFLFKPLRRPANLYHMFVKIERQTTKLQPLITLLLVLNIYGQTLTLSMHTNTVYTCFIKKTVYYLLRYQQRNNTRKPFSIQF